MSESGRSEGSIAHRLINPAVHIRGSTSAEPVLGSPVLVYFLTYSLAAFCTSCFHNPPSSVSLPEIPTPSFFLYIFSKYIPLSVLKTLDSVEFINFPLISLVNIYRQYWSWEFRLLKLIVI